VFIGFVLESQAEHQLEKGHGAPIENEAGGEEHGDGQGQKREIFEVFPVFGHNWVWVRIDVHTHL